MPDLRSVQPLAATPAVSLVIVTYKGVSFVGKCLDRVGAQSFTDAEVILVENGSKDGTCEMVREKYPWVRLIESETNRGFTGGVNLGVKNARGELVALLNNDGRPEPQWLAELYALSARARPGDLMSSVIKNEGMGDLEDHYGWTLNILGRSHRHNLTPPDFLFFGAGAGMMFNRSVYSEPFPEFYFIYNDDTYLGWLARLRGFTVLVSLKSRIFHEGSATMKQMHSIGAFHGEKNRMVNNLIFWERVNLLKLAPALAGDALLHLRRYPIPLIKAAAWVFFNRRVIRRMRSEVQATRKVPDAELLRFVSSRVDHGEGRFARWANALSASYCRAFGITTLESSGAFETPRAPDTGAIPPGRVAG
jgi:GT2 family glycosyltransferase